MKPTPETDEQTFTYATAHLNRPPNDYKMVRAGFAQQLERERNELREAMEALLKDHNQFSMDRFEMEGVDPYGNDSEAYDTAQKIIEGYKPLPTPPADADAAPDAS